MSCKGLIYAGLMMIMSVFITSNAQAKIVTPSALFNTAINQNVTEENATPDVTLVGRRHHYRRHYRYRHRGYRHRGYRRYGYRRHYGYGHRYRYRHRGYRRHRYGRRYYRRHHYGYPYYSFLGGFPFYGGYGYGRY